MIRRAAAKLHDDRKFAMKSLLWTLFVIARAVPKSMRFHINLRRDLRQLSDEALAERFATTAAARDEVGKILRLSAFNKTARGPIRHPFAYRLYPMMGINSGAPLAGIAIAAFLANMNTLSDWLRKGDRRYNAYLLECDLLDIHDEIGRRLMKRKRRG